MRLHVAVVRLDGVNNCFGFLVLAGDIDADGDMAALDLMFAVATSTPSSAAISPAIWETSMEWFSTFWP